MYGFSGKIEVSIKNRQEKKIENIFQYSAENNKKIIEIIVEKDHKKIKIDKHIVHYCEKIDFNKEIIATGRIFITYQNTPYYKSIVATIELILEYDYDLHQYILKPFIKKISKLFHHLQKVDILDPNFNIDAIQHPEQSILENFKKTNVIFRRTLIHENNHEEPILAYLEESKNNLIIFMEDIRENVFAESEDIINDPQIEKTLYNNILSTRIDHYKKTLSAHEAIEKIHIIDKNNIQKSSKDILEKYHFLANHLSRIEEKCIP